MKETKEPQQKDMSFAETANSLAQISKYLGASIIIMAGLVVMVKLGKAMFKDVKEMGL